MCFYRHAGPYGPEEGFCSGSGDRELQGLERVSVCAQAIAGGTLSHARVACEGPRATGTTEDIAPRNVGRGPVPRNA